MTNTSTQLQKASLKPLQRLDNPNITQRVDYDSLNQQEKDNVDYLVEKHNLTFQEAITLVVNDELWSGFLKDLKKRTDLKNIEIIENAQKKINEKIEQGFMEAAQKGSLILAILQDKTFGVPSAQGGPMFNVAGKQVSIKVRFGFKPYQKK